MSSSGLPVIGGTVGVPIVGTVNGVAVTGTPSSGQVLTATSSTAADWQSPSGGTPAFSAITGATNTSAAMVLGSGSSLTVSGSGTNNATAVDGVTVTGTPSTGQVPTATSSSAATWQTPAASSVNAIPIPNTYRSYLWQYDMGSSGPGGANPATFSCGGIFMTMASPGGGATTTSALFGAYVGLYSSNGISIAGFSTWKIFYVGNSLRFQTMAACWMSVTTDVTRVWLGFTDQTPSTMCGSANPAGNYACFRFISGTDTYFQCITKNGTTQNVQSSGIAPSAGWLAGTTPLKFEIQSNDSVPNVVFLIGGSVVATSTTDLPTSGTALLWMFSAVSTSSIGLGPGINYLYAQCTQ